MDVSLWSAVAIACLAGLLYTWVGYPLLCALLARWRPRPLRLVGPAPTSVSVLIVACDEARHIADKLRSLLAARGAERLLEILVVSDGSRDATAASARTVGDPRVRVEEHPERRGKAAAFNRWIPTLRAPIVVLTDARQPLAAETLERLWEPFRDPSIGVVSGELAFQLEGDVTGAARGIDAYWRYEKFIRLRESRWGSVPGSTGALTAFRRDAFRPLHPDTVLDDVALPLAVMRQGYRCILEPGALAYDRPHADARREAVRKRRTLAGNLQLVWLDPGLLLPWRNPVWFPFVSHKLARLFSPAFLLGLAAAAVALRGEPGPRGWLFPALCAGVLLAVLGALAQGRGWRVGLLGLPHLFLRLHLALIQAWGDALRGRWRAAWDRSDKQAAD
jgi:cellulose synthase/poly-beta-1,6-N-acetylglucosamine synthase-like glycosyltransferase